MVAKSQITKLILIALGVFSVCMVRGENYQAWSVITDSSDSHLEFSMNIDESVKNIEFDLKANSEKDHKGELKPLLLLLSEYFEAARNNDIKKIKGLYFIDDGSRERFQKEIKRMPQKFLKFNQVTKVTLDEVVKWGGYRAVNLRYYGDKGLLTPFTELAYCGKDFCKLSNRVFSQNESFSFFTALLGLVPKSKKIEYKNNKQIPIYPKFSNGEFPIYLNVKLGKFNTKDIVKRGNISKVLKISTDTKPIVDFVNSVWKLDVNKNYILDNEEISIKNNTENLIYANKVINKVFLSTWDKSYSQILIPNYMLGGKKITKKTTDDGSRKAFESTHYTDLSLSQLITKWEKFQYEGYIQTKKIIYIWVKYELTDSNEGILLFSVDKASKKLTSGTGVLNNLITNKYFFEIVSGLLARSKNGQPLLKKQFKTEKRTSNI